MEQVKPRRAVQTAAAANDADPPSSELAAARKAAQEFLVDQLQARVVRITKLAPQPDGGAGWYGEAQMLVLDLGIRTPGLPLTREALEKEYCGVDFDAALAVISYEMLDPRER
jgi:hypothetical protein